MSFKSDNKTVRMKTSKESMNGDEDKVEKRGCCFSFLGKCVAPKAQDVGKNRSSNNLNTYQAAVDVETSSSTSVAESFTSTPNITGELKVASQLIRYTFNELKLATSGFKPESIIGEGGFGRVYKGLVKDRGAVHTKSNKVVAVKTLNHDGLQGHREWIAEVYFLGDLLHPNLVKLIGYCIEDDQRMLIYEFMPRGSLENHLFRRSFPLSWTLSMKILYGAAKGLSFLHEEAGRPVIFRDFKTSNILLDADFNAKLSDFGLAKDGPTGDKTHVSTRVMGTYGYAAPEYVMTGHLTSKSDVYSFGVVLLEMLTGRKSVDKNKPPGQQNLTDWVRPYIAGRYRYFRIIDPRLEGQFSIRGAEIAIQLAVRCLRSNPKNRPLMSEVVEVLKPLEQMNDFASSSTYFQAMHAERNNGNLQARNVARQQGGSPYRMGQLTRSPTPLNTPHGSPLLFSHPRRSPRN